MDRYYLAWTISFTAWLTGGVGFAEVLDSGPQGFTVVNQITIAADPASVYRTLVGDIGAWWEGDHTFFGDASRLSIEDRPGGCFCEQGERGQAARHLTVVLVDPEKTLRMRGGLGPLQGDGVDGALTWTFASLPEGGTSVELSYRVGGYVASGLAGWAKPVDGVLSTQLSRLKGYIETGSPE